jgi:hypothetical protein
LAPLSGWAAEKHQHDEEKYDGPVLRVAIMGLGYYGSLVADAMRSCTKAKLVGLVSGTPAKLKAWQSKYGIPDKNCYNYTNFDSIKKQSRYRRGIRDHPKCFTSRPCASYCENR